LVLEASSDPDQKQNKLAEALANGRLAGHGGPQGRHRNLSADPTDRAFEKEMGAQYPMPHAGLALQACALESSRGVFGCQYT
jgi:hypothetical protein